MNPSFPPLYAILSADLFPSPESGHAEEFAETLANAGVGIIQYRNKHATSRDLFEVSSRICHALTGISIRFIVNDRPDIARLAGADGVHVGQEDLPVEEARAVCQESIPHRAGAAEKFAVGVSSEFEVDVPNKFWVGVSTHTLEQVREAAATSADYIAIGPIFATTTKQRPDAIVGTNFIRQARQLTTKPLVAIGGITIATAEEVFRAGADSIAVARDLIYASHPAARAAEYLAIADARRHPEANRSGSSS
jgi:thiamine-phosphate pyrophosphorylase